MRTRRRIAAALAAMGLAAFGGAGVAQAEEGYGFQPGSATASLSTLQAGGHPDVHVAFQIARETDPTPALENGKPHGSTRETDTVLPAGLVGNPSVLATCPLTDVVRMMVLTNGPQNQKACPRDAAVGEATIKIRYAYVPFALPYRMRVYRLPTGPNEPPAFGMSILANPIKLVASLRSDGDYGLNLTGVQLPEPQLLHSVDVTFWGVPADHQGVGPLWDGNPNVAMAGEDSKYGAPLPDAPRKAFMSNPTSCSGSSLSMGMGLRSYADPLTQVFENLPLGEITGCGLVPFDPSIDVTPDSTRAGQPAGYRVDVSVPQSDDADQLASAHLKDAVVTMPQGVALNPAVADGLVACSDAQFAVSSKAPESCPAASRIGSVKIDTPVLDFPMTGSVYIATQQSHDSASGRMYRLFVTAAGSGMRIKLRAQVAVDPVTGQITTSFLDNPQLPFSTFSLMFKGGARAPLVNPTSCGTYTTHAALTAWSGKVANVESAMRIDQGCDVAAKFEPTATTGVTNPSAGVTSPFVLRFSRPDGQQELGAINGSLPPGLLAYLSSVSLCSAAQGAAGTCPAASRVGKVQVQAGAGASPLWLPQAGQVENPVYVTEPYRKGDVAGLSIVVHAAAGPFDLGTVVTKAYLKLRDSDQGIDMQSDRLPRIVGGVPVQIRQVLVTVDRKDFMVNPTNCSPMAVYGNVFSQSWSKVALSNRFQVGGCASLAFSPIIGAKAGGKGDTGRYDHPSLKVTVRQPAGQAHLDKAYVVLPKALNIDLKAPALKAACPRDLYAKDDCSPVATVGTVKAVTPLLRQPLVGPAFLIQKKGQLPDLVMRLRNNRMHLDLIGVLDFLKDGRLITRVKGIPDAALSSFELNIKGGKDGSLLNRSSLCTRHRLVKATFAGQNGKRSYKTPLLHIAGCGKVKAKTKAKARRASRAAASRASARAASAATRTGGDQRATGGRS